MKDTEREMRFTPQSGYRAKKTSREVTDSLVASLPRTTEREKLKPCPFCGGEAFLYHDTQCDYESGWFHGVECKNKGCHAGVSINISDKDKAAAAWNRRADTARIAELEGEVRSLNDRMIDWEKIDAEADGIIADQGDEIRKLQAQLKAAVDERDKAEETVNQMYYLMIGISPEWSNNFGHTQAIQDVDDAQHTMRQSLKTTQECYEAENARLTAEVNNLKQHNEKLGDFNSEMAIKIEHLEDTHRAEGVIMQQYKVYGKYPDEFPDNADLADIIVRGLEAEVAKMENDILDKKDDIKSLRKYIQHKLSKRVKKSN